MLHNTVPVDPPRKCIEQKRCALLCSSMDFLHKANGDRDIGDFLFTPSSQILSIDELDLYLILIFKKICVYNFENSFFWGAFPR